MAARYSRIVSFEHIAIGNQIRTSVGCELEGGCRNACVFLRRAGDCPHKRASVRRDACAALPENVLQESSEQARAHGASPRPSPRKNTARCRLNESTPSESSRVNEEDPNLYSELSLEIPLPPPLPPCTACIRSKRYHRLSQGAWTYYLSSSSIMSHLV